MTRPLEKKEEILSWVSPDGIGHHDLISCLVQGPAFIFQYWCQPSPAPEPGRTHGVCVCIGSLHVGPQFSMGSSFYLPSPWTPATVLTLDVLRDFYPGLTLHCHCPFFESLGGCPYGFCFPSKTKPLNTTGLYFCAAFVHGPLGQSLKFSFRVVVGRRS